VSRIVVGILGTAVIALYAAGSRRLVATDSQWYRSLVKPAWQPPRIVIGLIWPYNFAMLTTATWFVASRLSTLQHLVWLISLTLSVLAALIWAWLFFHRHRLFASGVSLVFATLFAVPLLVISFNAFPVLGFAFVPYQLWLVLATSIAFGFSAQ
jgi:tryptophan-rich sensory protein